MEITTKKAIACGILCGGLCLCACDRTIAPRIAVLETEPCVLTLTYWDGDLGSNRTTRIQTWDHFILLRRTGETNLQLEKATLHDANGRLICVAEGKEFMERYRKAPIQNSDFYGLVLGRDGPRWMSKREYRKLEICAPQEENVRWKAEKVLETDGNSKEGPRVEP